MKYKREIFSIGYKIKNYDNKAKCEYKVKDRSSGRIKKHLIIGLKEYNI